MIKSVIRTDEKIDNQARRFGAAREYFPCLIQDRDGNQVPAMFTMDQLDVATARAAANPEDCEELQGQSLWERIFG
ncbi:MAG: hypothetical protein ACOY4W_16705 [Thermodesulfobacteriota bacterium]